MRPEKLLLDTHTLIWLMHGSDRLGLHARNAIETAVDRESIYLSGISLWEIACAQRANRLKVDDLATFWSECCGLLKAKELGMRIKTFFTLADEANFLGLHRDPADRILVATALEYKLQLVTADSKIIPWAEKSELNLLDARL